MKSEVLWRCLPFAELTPDLLYAIVGARESVFIVEQNCPYQDADGKDLTSLHLFATDSAGGLLAYLRILPPGVSFREPSLGRVLTTAGGRGKGLGKELLQRGIDRAQREYRGQGIRISAQFYLRDFYSAFGFRQVSEVYLEDGIEHIEMFLDGEGGVAK